MEDLIFLKNYRDDKASRSSLNTLMQLNCGYSLEAWYAMGYWQEQYIPYSFAKGTQIVANISVYKQDILYEGEQKSAIRLEHILLHPQYHYKNLLQKLMEYIIEEYKEQVDFIYLIANEAVTPLYPKLGFRYIEDIQTCIQVDKIEQGKAPILVSYENLVQNVKQYPETFTVLSKGLKSKNDFLRRNFDYMNIYDLSIYYFEEMNTYVTIQIQEDTLNIMDILSKQKIDLDYIITGLKAVHKFKKVRMYSDIPYEGCGEVLEEVGSQLLFVKDELTEKENLFPIFIS